MLKNKMDSRLRGNDNNGKDVLRGWARERQKLWLKIKI
jgi:hypothetical protein